MSHKTRLGLVDLETLASPPPVLRSEDRELYEKIRERFMVCFAPEDILEWHLVNRLIEEPGLSSAIPATRQWLWNAGTTSHSNFRRSERRRKAQERRLWRTASRRE
jgi:hypothetical protein